MCGRPDQFAGKTVEFRQINCKNASYSGCSAIYPVKNSLEKNKKCGRIP